MVSLAEGERLARSGSAPPSASAEKALRLSFHGMAAEYFRIWILSLFLSVVTLGLYSPWAKVRRRQYLYARTVLDGTPFRYVGDPLVILRGRVIGAGVLALFFLCTEVVVSARAYALVVAVLAAPWVVIRAVQFEARCSRFRNIGFDFRGDYRSASRALAGALLLAATGIGLPWAYCRVGRYVARQLSYGGATGQFACRGERLFTAFVAAASLVVGALACCSWLLAAVVSGTVSGGEWVFPICGVVAYGAFLAAYSLWRSRAENAMWRGARLGPLRFVATLRARGLFVLYLTNTLATVVSLGLLVPWATIRTIRHRIAHLSVIADDDWSAVPVAPRLPRRGHTSALTESLLPDLVVPS